MNYRLLLAPILLWPVALVVQGQPIVIEDVPGPPPVPIQVPANRKGPAPATAPRPTAAAATAAATVGLLGSPRSGGPILAVASFIARTPLAAVPESPRLARLKQLPFDRRPSTILKTWAHPPEAKTGKAKQPAKDALTVELETLQKNVTLGNWIQVKAYLAGLPAAEGKAGYKQLLQSLQGNPGGQQGPMMMGPQGPMPMQRMEQNVFTADDIIGLATAAPGGLDNDHLPNLGNILRRALDGNTVTPEVVSRFQTEITKGPGKAALTKRQAAQLLLRTNEAVAAGTFLPGLDQAIADKDAEGLNLLARHFLGVHGQEKKVLFLERAWSATQAVLAQESSKAEEKTEALQRAVELAPRIKEELGQAWLDQSFTNHPDRGMDILATIGTVVSQGMMNRPQNPDERLKVLLLQKTAVEALLKAAPQRATQWRGSLTLLAGVWLREAEYTNQTDRSGSRMRRDRFGNPYWMGDDYQYQMMMRQNNQPFPIATSDLLRSHPSTGWIGQLGAGERSKLAMILARLYLKADDENKAFPYIKEVAPTNQEVARELVNEFLRVWTTNHDPNTQRQYANPYYYFYPFEMRAEGIPLTRSKQERNLKELSGWVKELRQLLLKDLDEELLVNAFTKCHSSAEVYRLEAIEEVFGRLDKIKPRTLASLVQKTRENLAGLWREPAEQQKQKTNRKQKDIQVEVLRGYELANKVISDALKQFPNDWSLTQARAALLHDETNYRQEVAKSSDYSKKRDEAIAAFQKAAALYADQVKKLTEDEETIGVYQQWFHASLGACDVAQLDEEKLPDPRQAPLIRKALQILPAEVAERHMNKMADALVADLRRVRPTAKHRYLKQGFAIIGDNKQAAEARKIFDYYKDLITEIKLDVVLDGSDKVGHKQAFGVFVNIRHTREIERESGGFGRYLQNQNAMQWSYNFGRPQTDYRDRFQAAATEALKEHFDIVSFTFQTEKVHSRATPEYGWRTTPYAYLLLKPRGPQVDKIPPLHLDLDFADTTYDFSDMRRAPGYVILPVESPAVPIDASSEHGVSRPVRKLQITQILDERQAGKGKLGLEIKATGIGLIGNLDETLNLAPEGFEVVKVNDQGVSVAKFAEESDSNAIVSERTWLVELRARQDRAAAPKTFRFASPRVENAEMTYQRYQDADLAVAQQEVALENEYKGRGTAWLWIVGTSSAVLVLVLLLVMVKALRRRSGAKESMPLPDKLTPFTVTVLLRRIKQTGNLSPADREALDGAINELERCYFANSHGNGEINLRTLAEDWVRRVQ